MTAYIPNDAMTAAQTYDLSDLVQGGNSGDANVPIKALFDRTQFAYNRLGRWDDVHVLTDNYSWDVSDLRKWLVFQIAANKTFTLPAVGSLPVGTRVGVKASINALKSLTVQSVNNEQMIDGAISWTKWDIPSQPAMYMHDGDRLVLVAATDHWLVEVADGNFYNAGETFLDRKQRRNSMIAQGTLIQRADFPRVALFSLFGLAGGLVTDATWLSDPGGKPVYRGCFSSGDGQNSIRIPDERAMTSRGLDLGRGIFTGILYNSAGGYGPDGILTHSHAVKWELNGSDGIPNSRALYKGDVEGNGSGTDNTNSAIQPTGGTENTVKAIGKIPLMRY